MLLVIDSRVSETCLPLAACRLLGGSLRQPLGRGGELLAARGNAISGLDDLADDGCQSFRHAIEREGEATQLVLLLAPKTLA